MKFSSSFQNPKLMPNLQFCFAGSWEDVFSEKVARDRKMRNERVAQAVGEGGYSLREVADYLRLHYSTLSRPMKEREKSTSKAGSHKHK